MTGKEAQNIYDLVGLKMKLDMNIAKLKDDIENGRYDRDDHYGCPESVPMTALGTEYEKVCADLDSFKTK